MELTDEEKVYYLNKILEFIEEGLTRAVDHSNHDDLTGSNIQYHLRDARFLKNYSVKYATLSPMSMQDDVDKIIAFFEREENVEVLMSLLTEKLGLYDKDEDQLSFDF